MVCAVEVGEDGEHPAVTVLAVGDVELGEDVADVGFDGAFADHEPVCDGSVGESLGHELEHAALALREPADGSGVGWRNQVGDDHRITALLLVGELASIPIRNAQVDDTSAVIVGAIFGLASIASTCGFLLVGWATLRAGVWHGWRRFTPLVTGIWLVILTPVALASPTLLHGGVGIYGLCLLAMAIALRTAPGRAASAGSAPAGVPGVEPTLTSA